MHAVNYSIALSLESRGEQVLDAQAGAGTRPHSSGENWSPLNIVTVAGTPKCATLLAMLCSWNVPSAQVNQDRGLVVQNGGSLTARFVCGASSGRGISRCSVVPVTIVKVGKNLQTQQFDYN